MENKMRSTTTEELDEVTTKWSFELGQHQMENKTRSPPNGELDKVNMENSTRSAPNGEKMEVTTKWRFLDEFSTKWRIRRGHHQMEIL